MKKQRTSHYLVMAVIVGVFAFAAWSCNKDDDPSLTDLRDDKLQYLEDSLRISDSLRRVNAAGIVNYAITVVNASTSSMSGWNDGIWTDGGSRTSATKEVVDGAIVTISQFGKTETDTTDASGIAVFKGFFRSGVNVTVRKEGFTTASFVAAVSLGDNTPNGTINSVGNLIPIFETTGANTATITGRATIQTDLTNKTRELVPDGTKVTASIDATNSWFHDQYLSAGIPKAFYSYACECEVMFAGEIVHASYSTGVVGTVTNGNYSLTVPAAIDELPIWVDYSDVAATQTLYEQDASGELPGDRVATYRTLFGLDYSPSFIPSGSGVTISFNSGSGATANAVISATTGVIDRINVTNGGSGYAGTPLVQITDAMGTGAAATATVVNGVVTSITLTSGGSGYVAPVVTLIAGTGAGAGAATLGQDGTVTSVTITNSGSGYTTAPTVTFSAPTGTGLVTGVTATGTATITNGRVTAIAITNPGAGYTAAPTVTIGTPSATGSTPATAVAFYSGQSVQDVQVSSAGTDYTFAPRVTFSAPNIPTGRRATGVATFNATTRQVTGITITDGGMGYTSAPTVTLSSFTAPAAVESFLSGGSVISVDMLTNGSGYTGVPTVTFTGGGGQGAAGTAVVVDGRVVGINITSGGTGYTSTPTVTFNNGNGASGYATVSNGAISAITITDGGRFYVGSPLVTITSTVGGGATATATTNAAGAITGVTITNGGTGYLQGNTPAGFGDYFSTSRSTTVYAKPAKTFILDAYYGTGERQPN